MFRGCMTSLITPFHEGVVDHNAFRSLVEWQIEEGVDAVVTGDVVGEGPTLRTGNGRASFDWPRELPMAGFLSLRRPARTAPGGPSS